MEVYEGQYAVKYCWIKGGCLFYDALIYFIFFSEVESIDFPSNKLFAYVKGGLLWDGHGRVVSSERVKPVLYGRFGHDILHNFEIYFQF